MLDARIQEKLAALPARPGCYLFKDAAGQVLYVGKAISLRSRVRSYFQRSANLTVRIRRLVEAVRDLEVIVVESELEALVLECNLIKKHQPHYNVRLRDDKQYPYLCVTTSEPFPRLLLTRRVRQDGNKYFGPYSGSRAVYATMELMKRLFPLVSCGKAFDGRPVQKPCLYYHMGQCLAPCAGLADRKEYQHAVRDVIAFLQGQPEKVVRDLRVQMDRAAEDLNFERAARLRDQIQAVEEVMARQKVISSQVIDQDVIAVVADQGGACVQMFYIRGGKLIGQNSFLLEGEGEEGSPSEAVQEFVKQYYTSAAYVPQEILLPCDIDETAIVQQWLRQKRGSKVEITVPLRGDKRRLVQMASENAGHALEQMRAEMRTRLGSRERALEELAEELGLPAPPRRIECFDISNFQGDHFVGSMVVCEDGEMSKSEYRRFKIKFHDHKPDDVAMIREVVSRRLAEARAGNPKFIRLPDLLMVDGGKGQLASAAAAILASGFRIQGSDVLEAPGEEERQATREGEGAPGAHGPAMGAGTERESGAPAGAIEAGREPERPSASSHQPPFAVQACARTAPVIPVAGLAKRFEHLHVPGEPDPVILPRTSQALYLVQRIRDEAHRFANAYRVALQTKRQTTSALDLVPGIGPRRRRALLRHFGSIEKIRNATVEEIAAVPTMNRQAASTLHSYLQAAA